jgi:hypothetical protein
MERQFPPRPRLNFNLLHSVKAQKAENIITIAAKTSNPTNYKNIKEKTRLKISCNLHFHISMCLNVINRRIIELSGRMTLKLTTFSGE